MRAGLYDEKNQIQPQMLVRENATLKRIDLNQMQVFEMSDAEYSEYFKYGDMILYKMMNITIHILDY